MIEEVTTGNMFVGLIALASPTATLAMAWRKMRRDSEADIVAKIAPIAASVEAMRAVIAVHVPRDDIDRADAAVRAVADQAVREIGDLRERFGRLDERQQAADGQLGELKQLMEKRFDKLQDCLSEISRKVC